MRPSKNQPLINALATEIKLRRQTLGWSQEDLAGACELDRPYISMIEIGRKQPTLSVLMRLAEGLQFSLAEFMALVEHRYRKDIAVRATDVVSPD